MQVFQPSNDYNQVARMLDRQRLGKQRVEALQLVNVAAKIRQGNLKPGWHRHPAFLQWKDHIPALLRYTTAMMQEWTRRGYRNDACQKAADEHRDRFSGGENPIFPHEVYVSHVCLLVQKDPLFYIPTFQANAIEIPENWREWNYDWSGPIISTHTSQT